ncbi:hypothetical protein NBRC116493_35340 [Aurantivibrio infirmus]
MQDTIIRAFGIDRNELAKLCHVPFSTLTQWHMNSTTIQQHTNIPRLFKLYEAAVGWESMGYLVPGDYIRESSPGLPSLYELLIAESIDIDAIMFRGSRRCLRQVDPSEVIDPFSP